MDNVRHDRGHYQRAIDFLYERLNFERTVNMPYRQAELRLDRMIRLLELLGNPQRNQRIIHVAGTKGKGSTCCVLSSILQQAGYRTGLYTSPHLLRVEERLAIDGRPCSAQELVDLVDRIRPVVEQLERQAAASDGQGPTFFELTTAIALLHFAQQQVDYTILEVGLGGRLDSTNVCQPLVTVITSISYDHMRQLGRTLEAIAREKAGIIKPGVPVISGVIPAGPRDVIWQVARQQQCELRNLGCDFDVDYRAPICRDAASCRPQMNYYRQEGDHRQLMLAEANLGLLGPHQAANAGLALATCEVLRARGAQLSEVALRRGLERVYSPARVEVMSWRPAVIIDTAHNIASIEALIQVIRTSFPQRPRHLVFGTTRGKDVTGMLRLLIEHFDQIICTCYVNNPRALPPSDLIRQARRLATDAGRSIKLLECPTPAAAWQAVWQQAGPDDLICLTGSFFIAAEFLALAQKPSAPSAALP